MVDAPVAGTDWTVAVPGLPPPVVGPALYPEPVPHVRIEVLAAPSVNQAMAHNHLPFLHRITCTLGDTDLPLPEARVTVRVVAADGTTVSRPYDRPLALNPGEPVTLDTPEVPLDPAYLAAVEEEIAAELVVTVQAGAQQVARAITPIRILAARQWLMDPTAPLRSLELLAAFVQPNHPAVAALVGDVAEHLHRETGSGSLAVHNVSAERIDAIVSAVCEAVHRRDIYYAEPPAGWGSGQPVRTPADVLDDRLGTCLDLTLTLAAIMEHIGVTPVLWIAQGHAFCGYWRGSDYGLPEAAAVQLGQAINAVDLKLMGVLEATLLTRERRPPRDLFRCVRQDPIDRYFHGGTSQLVGVVDLGMARLLHVLPIPARHVRPDGVVEVIEYRPAATAEPAGPGFAQPGDAPAAHDHRDHAPRRTPPPRVQVWQQHLLDLSLRNRLLNLNQQTTQLPLIVPPEELGRISRALADEQTLSVRALDDLAGAVIGQEARDAYALPGDIQRNMLAQRRTIYSTLPGKQHVDALQRLRQRARTALQETGANPLTLTLGRLDWRLGERALSAPLLLQPVDIRGVVQPYKIVADDAADEPLLNLSLMEKLRVEFGFTVPELHELPRTAEGLVDVPAVVTAFRQALARTELGFRLETEARLAILSFTGYLLWRDLDEHWERFCAQPLLRHLIARPTQRFAEAEGQRAGPLDDLDEVTATAPIPADGAQAEAIAAARAGESFVLEGPPGTGKSQTITNILADQLARGKRVLFVAEKAAALDVVKARLAEVGLLPYALDLHDQGSRPAQVRERLRSALAQEPQPDPAGYEVAWASARSTARALAGYADRLHAPGGTGLSLYTAHGARLAHGEGAVATVPEPLTADRTQVDAVRAAVERADAELGLLARDDATGWGFAARDPGEGAAAVVDTAADADRLVAAALEVAETAERAGAAGSTALGLLRSARTHAELTALLWLLSHAWADGTDLARMGTDRWQAERAEAGRCTERLRLDAEPLGARFEPGVLEVPLGPVRQAVREAAASFFLGRKRRLLRAAAPVLAALRPGANVAARELPELVEQLASLVEEHGTVLARWRSLPGTGALPAGLNLLDPADAATLQAAVSAAGHAADLLATLSPQRRDAVIRARAAEAPLPPTLGAAWEAAADAVGAVLHGTGSAADTQWWWSGTAGLLPTWQDSAPARAADAPHGYRLRRFGAAATALEPLRSAAPQARWELLSGAAAGESASAFFTRGLVRAAEAERYAAGGFAGFDATAQDRAALRFVGASSRLREALRTALPADILGRRPFRSGALFGQVAALEREINRSRGGLSVRQLMSTYGPVITAITPVVLVSPDSLARFVPADAVDFDLVVFDEASQITVADAVGALGRAAAVVVAGDSKQLPPWTFGGPADEDEQLALPAAGDERDDRTGDSSAGGSPDDGASTDDASTDDADPAAEYWLVPDEESVLGECGQAGMTRRWLSWHYRSRDEALIAFSNAHYYGGRLSSFPAVPGADSDTGISFVRIQGHFVRSRTRDEADAPKTEVADADATARRAGSSATRDATRLLRTNPAEAAAVADEVLRRWRAGERSLGVVTFNVQQRGLIEQLLWDSGVEGVAESLVARAGEGLFVKNLENVQGDERDVIIFSTGFSANARGVLPLNFGPLNRVGGERRLNVAITRARRRVMVFCSFEPEDLRAEQTSSVGIKHLRGYLELAKYGPAALGAAEDADPALRPVSRGPSIDRHRDELAAALRERGFDVHAALGMSEFRIDLAIGPAERPGPPVLAVLLDGPEWATRRTVGDRDGLPTTVLTGLMSWPGVARVWLPEWLADPERVLDRLAGQARAAAEVTQQVGESRRMASWATYDPTDVSAVADPAQPEFPLLGVGDGAASSVSDGPPTLVPGLGEDPEPEGAFTPYQPARLRSRRELDDAPTRHRAAEAVQAVMRAVLAAEGPVSVERLGRLVVATYGLSRLSDARRDDLRRLIPPEVRRDPEDGFCWPPAQDPLTWDGYRRTAPGGLKARPLDDVALREIANAACEIVRGAMGISADELGRELVRVFGGSRVTPTVRPRLDAAVALAERLGLVRRSGELLVPGTGRVQAQ